jgi:hypothetical protein
MVLLTFLALVAFAPTLRLPFQFDDHAYIESNPNLRRWDLTSLSHDFHPALEGPQGFYFRPLQTFVNRLQYSAVGLNPWLYHFTNLIFHAGNAILLTELLLLLGFSSLAALVAGALFAVHPIIVSELLMVSGLPEIMCFFFSLAALLMLLRRDRLLWVGIFYILALLSKESALAVPLYYGIICLFRPQKEDNRTSWITLIAITLAYLLWRTLALGMAGISRSILPWPSFILCRLPVIFFRYTTLILFPWNLHAYRLIPAMSPLWAYIFAALAVAVYIAKGKPAWAKFCILWGLAAFIPKIPLLFSGQYMLDHWAYPALPAVLLPIGILLARGWESKSAFWRKAATVACTCFLCFFIFSAQFHTLMRADDEKNYRWSLRFTRATPILFNLGLICLKTGRAAEAVSYMEPIEALYPEDPNIRHALVDAYILAGRPTDAQRLVK